MSRRLLIFMLGAVAANATAQEGLVPQSVYHVAAPLTDQNGRTEPFAAKRGEVNIISMFYTSCPNVCPLLIETIKLTERALSEQERDSLKVLLVSLDPERDTPSKLKQLLLQRQLDESRWSLLHTEAANVRKLAAVLGIQYRQLDNQEVNHSSVLILLDREGRVLARSNKLGAVDAQFLEALRKALSSP